MKEFIHDFFNDKKTFETWFGKVLFYGCSLIITLAFLTLAVVNLIKG